MSSNHATHPVKLFIDVLAMEDAHLEERLEEELFSEYGPSDHRMILVPSDKTIHRVFLSFDRLIEIGNFPRLREQSRSTERKNSSKMVVGFVDNRRVAVESVSGSGGVEDVIQFNNGRMLFLPGTHPDYMNDESQKFFLSMRKTFRAQLRSFCLLRR
jgi:hypothetical protein